MNKSRKIIFLSLFLLMLVAMPVVSASCAADPDDHAGLAQGSQIEALKGVACGFKSIFAGDIGEALAWFLVGGAVYIVGTFLLIYYLMMFVLKTTLIKGDEHKSVRNGLCIGFSLLGTATPKIYTLTVTFLGGTGLMFVLLGFVGYTGFIMYKGFQTKSNDAKTADYKSKAESHKARAQEAKENGLARKATLDETAETKLEEKEGKMINASRTQINNVLQKASNFKEQLLAMRTVLYQLAGVRSDSSAYLATKKSLLAQASAFTDHIKKGETEIINAKILTKKAELLEFKELKLEEDSNKSILAIKKLELDKLRRSNGSVTARSIQGKEIAKKFFAFESDLEKHIRTAHNLDARKIHLVDDVRSVERNIIQQFEDIKSTQSSMVNALNSGTADSVRIAITDVDNAIRLEERIDAEIKDLARVQFEVTTLETDKATLERAIKALMKKIRAITI